LLQKFQTILRDSSHIGYIRVRINVAKYLKDVRLIKDPEQMDQFQKRWEDFSTVISPSEPRKENVWLENYGELVQ
jgi:hypothetical protein